ncbi:MAG: nucleotidyltransferase domain-containing protein [Calditrichaeota bacterium]|nr:nucleotidyltransferase domain-containing protein [Calditrichota bacterium]
MKDESRPRIELDQEKIKAFCSKWQIVELSLFGSVLTDDFRPDSDVDVMVTFAAGARWKLWDVDEAERELAEMIGRPVDLVERVSVEKSRNYIRRNHILDHARRIYVA